MYCGDETGGLVLDVGFSTVKFGFAGEDMPKLVFPSTVGAKEEETGKRLLFGDGALHSSPVNTEILHNYVDGSVTDWSLMEATIQYAFRELKVKPQEHPLLLVDSAVANSMQPQREKFVELLFERFNVPAMYLGRSAVLSAFSAGRSTAMVIDIGAASTRVCPVFEGHLLLKSSQTSLLGGHRLDMEVLRMLEDSTSPTVVRPRFSFRKKMVSGVPVVSTLDFDVGDVRASYNTHMKLEVAREIKESLCSVSPVPLRYVSPSVVGQSSAASSLVVDGMYELPDGQKFSAGDIEFKIPELLFDPLPLMELCCNLIVVGGGAALKGVSKRLSNELASLIPLAFKVKMLEAGVLERRFAPFIGGSILASLGTFQQLWMSKLEYEEEGPGGIDRRMP